MKIYKISCVKCDKVFASFTDKENTCQACQKETPDFKDHRKERMDEFYGRVWWK